MKKGRVLLGLFCLPLTVWSEGNNYGAASYQRDGAGARASGMGGAFVAIADDATAGYWNPAGLSQMEPNDYQAALEYAFLPNNLSTSFLSFCFLLPGVGNFSLSWMNFSEGVLEGRDISGNILPDFNASENSFFLSYGNKFYGWVKGLSLGASLKGLQQSVGNASAAGPGLDVAALWQPDLAYDHTLGVNVQNLFQRIYWNGGSNAIDYSQVNVKAGVALKFLRSEGELYFNHLITALDLEFSEYQRFSLRIGSEYWYWSNLGLRAGYNGQEVTAGVSYRPDNYEVDYAFHYDLSDMGAHQHRISLLLRFAGPPQPVATAIPEPAVVIEQPEPVVAKSPTPSLTPEITINPTPNPSMDISKELAQEEAEPKYNFLTTNPFGSSSISSDSLGTFKLEYERRIAKRLTVSLVGLYCLQSMLLDIASAAGNGIYAEYGLGLEPRYYFSNDNTPQGYWLGALGAYRTGSVDLSYPATYSRPAYITKESTQVIMSGLETGYKWVFWNWFVVSPYLGTYYEQRKFLSNNSTLFYTGGGVNVGMTF